MRNFRNALGRKKCFIQTSTDTESLLIKLLRQNESYFVVCGAKPSEVRFARFEIVLCYDRRDFFCTQRTLSTIQSKWRQRDRLDKSIRARSVFRVDVVLIVDEKWKFLIGQKQFDQLARLELAPTFQSKVLPVIPSKKPSKLIYENSLFPHCFKSSDLATVCCCCRLRTGFWLLLQIHLFRFTYAKHMNKREEKVSKTFQYHYVEDLRRIIAHRYNSGPVHPAISL